MIQNFIRSGGSCSLGPSFDSQGELTDPKLLLLSVGSSSTQVGATSSSSRWHAIAFSMKAYDAAGLSVSVPTGTKASLVNRLTQLLSTGRYFRYFSGCFLGARGPGKSHKLRQRAGRQWPSLTRSDLWY